VLLVLPVLSTAVLVQIPEEELDPFNVLGVDIHASESELKRAYRQLAVQVR